jgi:hypothetical protein
MELQLPLKSARAGSHALGKVNTLALQALHSCKIALGSSTNLSKAQARALKISFLSLGS